MTKQEILTQLQECAKKLDRVPRYPELRRLGINRYQVEKHFADLTHAFREAGIKMTAPRRRIEPLTLFEDWVRVARDLQALPTRDEYESLGHHSGMPFFRLCGQWTRVPEYFRSFARKIDREEEWKDVLRMVEKYLGPAPEVLSLRTGQGEEVVASTIRHSRRKTRDDRPVYGPPSSLPGLLYEPANELGVIYAFGMIAKKLGIHVQRIQPGFPDCEAMRETEPAKWQTVRIEFEFASRNFLDHQHPADGCDMIVCWTHNWPECPEHLEVVELKRVLRGT